MPCYIGVKYCMFFPAVSHMLTACSVLLAALCLVVLSKKGGLRGRNWILASVIGVQFVICTGHIISLLVQLIRGFIHIPPPPTSPGAIPDSSKALNGTALYFTDLSTPEHVAEVVFYIINSLIADCFMTWRVFVFWDRNWYLAAPFVLLNTVTLVFGVLTIQATSTVGYHINAYFTGKVQMHIVTVWAVTVVTQTAGTLLIVWREVSTPIYVSPSRKRRGCSMVKALCLAVDSGAAYTSCIVLVLAFYLCSDPAGAVVVAILGQISATVPLTIILREWWKVTMNKAKAWQGPLLPHNTLLTESHELESRNALQLPTDSLTTDNGGSGVRIMKSTHMRSDVHSIAASDEGPLKSTRIGSYPSI
ncbi:unnamed protein product [Peniophora sp. CBMAI 1063]|nr:unnamed protein product [Peniophora sp. CBMAI 1063]